MQPAPCLYLDPYQYKYKPLKTITFIHTFMFAGQCQLSWSSLDQFSVEAGRAAICGSLSQTQWTLWAERQADHWPAANNL